MTTLANDDFIAAAGDRDAGAAARAPARDAWQRLLSWSFTLFGTARVVAYLPTIWAIENSGQSAQHSLWTWFTWLGANATMAAWLWEQNGRRVNRAVVVSSCNALLCAATLATIVAYR